VELGVATCSAIARRMSESSNGIARDRRTEKGEDELSPRRLSARRQPRGTACEAGRGRSGLLRAHSRYSRRRCRRRGTERRCNFATRLRNMFLLSGPERAVRSERPEPYPTVSECGRDSHARRATISERIRVLTERRQATLDPASSSPFFPVRAGLNPCDFRPGVGWPFPSCDMIWKDFRFCVRSALPSRFSCNSREFLSR
jgi:hypothetical protein